ncbi:MAG: DNA polymerase III subunit delta [Sphaerobacter sp.]|nr:DNA polymerase III subunit delta [Sphaerobacter sp.]
MILVLHGANRLGIDERVRELRDAHDPQGLTTTVVEDAASHLADLRSACLSPGFFGTNRLVIARDLLSARPAGRGRRGGSDRREVVDLLAQVPPSTVLVVVESELGAADERALRAAVPDLSVERHEVPRGRELVDWVRARARRYGVTVEPDAATRLLEALFPTAWRAVARRDDVPPDLYRLDAEVAKLATAAGPDGTVTPDLVAELVPDAEATNLWGLTDAIVAGDPAAAVREAERALATGTAAELLLGQLVSQFEVFAVLAAGERHSPAALAAETGISEARLKQAGQVARRFSRQRIARGLAALREVDVATKQGEAETADLLVGVVARLAADR